MSQKSITDLNINSITISNSNYANASGFTAQSNTLETNNSGVLLVNGVPISSGGGGAVDNIVEGDGIDVRESPTGTFTISNTGVLELTAGNNISITGSKNNLTIASTGGGGAVDNIVEGDGIDVTESSTGTFTISNTGVLELTAGNNISITGSKNNLTIASTGGGFTPVITQYNLPVNTDLVSVGTTTQLFAQPSNLIPSAGLYIINVFIITESYDSTDSPGPYLGSGRVTLYFTSGASEIAYINQPFSITPGSSSGQLQFSTTMVCNGVGYISLNLKMNSLFGNGTKYNVLSNDLSEYPHVLTLTKIA